MGGEGVAQTVYGDLLAQSGMSGGFAAGQLQRSGAHVAVLFPRREQPGLGIGAERLVVAPQRHVQAVGEHGITVFLALALFDAYEFAFAVDVGDLQRDGFGDTEAGAVAGHQSGAILKAGDVVEKQQHLFLAEDDGKLMRAFGAGEILFRPGHFERVEIEELKGRDAGVHALRRQLPFVQQVKQVLVDGFGVEFLGT